MTPAVPEPAEAVISTSGSAAIEALAAGPARAGLVLDFDGVLAPIVDDPESARYKFVLELRPATGIDKGTTLTRLVGERGLRTVAYVGDDVGDIPALRYAREAGGYALLVDHGTETPESLRGLADERFDGVESFQRWLADLADALERPA